MIEDKLKKVQTDEERRYIIGKIRATLDRIIELDDTIPLAIHINNIFKSSGEVSSTNKLQYPYHWTNDKLYGKVDEYYKKHRKAMEDRFDGIEDEPIDEEFLKERMKINTEVYGQIKK